MLTFSKSAATTLHNNKKSQRGAAAGQRTSTTKRTACLVLVGALSVYALCLSIRLTGNNNNSRSSPIYETVIDVGNNDRDLLTSSTRSGAAATAIGLKTITTDEQTTLSSLSICGWAALQNPMHLWVTHMDAVLAASRMKLDLRYRLEEITASVLHTITDRLPRSVKSSSHHDAETLHRVVDKLQARYEYLWTGAYPQPDDNNSAQPPPPPPPIKIAVLGGSVTAGTNCYTGRPKLHLQNCAWPARLERFVNEMARRMAAAASSSSSSSTGFVVDEPLIEVTTVAVGGSNTATGTTVLEYDLMPSNSNEGQQHESSPPDILINAYSTNDMHILTVNEAARSNMSVREKVFGMAQDFVRTAFKDDDCPANKSNKNKRQQPLLIWLDDYLGNEQREILATTELSQSIDVLANYYGFAFVSYADAVRDLVYGDTAETTFSPAGWYDNSNDTSKMQREIHPGQGMHMATAWIMAYNLFVQLTTHCSAEQFRLTQQQQQQQSKTSKRRRKAISKNRMDEQIEQYTPVLPRPRPTGLPPPLTSSLTLDVVSAEWQKASGKSATRTDDCSSISGPKCPFSWVSGVPWRDTNRTLAHFGSIVQTPNTDWEVIDENPRKLKYGWIPKPDIVNPKLVLEFEPAQYKTVTFFILKSYGPKWRGSMATAVIEQKVNDEWVPEPASRKLKGRHNKRTSETYTETVQLQKHPGSSAGAAALRVTLTLTGGTTFKLMGIAVCQ